MTATPVYELKAGAFRQVLPLVVDDHQLDDVEVATVLTVVQGPAPAPGSRETAEVLLVEAASRSHREDPPMHVLGLRFEQLITPVDVEALRDLPDLGPIVEPGEWRLSVDVTAQDLRANPDRYALAVIIERVPCPHYRQDPTA